MELARIRAILLDLDGTLVDSAPDLAAAVNRLLAERGADAVTEAQVRDWTGDGARRLVARALGDRLGEEPAEADLDGALERFLALYEEGVYVRSRPYPGVIEGVQRLAAAGLRLAVVTNKPQRLVEPILEPMGIRESIDAIVGGESTEAKKPDPEPLRLAMERLGAASATVLMVGDSATDVEAARNAGVPVACVPYGYRRGVAPAELGADAVIEDLRELSGLLRGAA